MPRARTTTATDDETVIKKPRATRSRAVSSNVNDTPAAPRRRRVSASAPATATESVNAVHHDTGRKAPTALGERQRVRNRTARRSYVVLGLCFVLFLAGFGIGVSDRGVIDVVAAVNERNEKINRGEVRDSNGQLITQTVGVQQPDTRPNGGMVPLEVQPTPVPETLPPPDMGTSTATSTATAATTTDATTASSTESVIE